MIDFGEVDRLLKEQRLAQKKERVRIYKQNPHVKEQNRIRAREWKLNNPELAKERERKTEQKRNEPIPCECGVMTSKHHRKKHEQTKKHRDRMAIINAMV